MPIEIAAAKIERDTGFKRADPGVTDLTKI
jgi:hypothetical protein